MRAVRVYVWVQVVLLGVFGCLYLFFPVPLAALTSHDLQAAAAITDIRGYYGGVQVGLAAFLLGELRSGRDLTTSLRVLTFLYASMAIGRILGFSLDGLLAQRTNLIAAATELSCAAIAWWGLRVLHRREPPTGSAR